MEAVALMASSNSTTNQVWFSNPEIEQEAEDYAKRRSYKQSLNLITQFKEEGEVIVVII